MQFCKAKRAEIKIQNPDATFGDLSRIMGTMWKGLNDKEKNAYKDSA